MTNIFSNEYKSFKIIRPTRNGRRIDYLGRTKQTNGVLYLSLSRSQDELMNGIKNLFGPNGTVKSFYRYYFPKRFIWNSTLYPKPKTTVMIDERSKKEAVLKNFMGFRGVPRNKIYDKLNLIVDYTDLFDLVVPNDRNILHKPNVNTYIENIIPEFMSYVLFFNRNHNSKLDEVDEEAMENLRKNIKWITDCESEEELEEPYWLPKALEKLKFPELSDESVKKYEEMSEESFKENLLAKTTLFNIGGPAIGIDQFGFNKYIVSIPITLQNPKYLSHNYLNHTLKVMQNIRWDPTQIYEISFTQFVNDCYKAYFSRCGTSNQFVNEVMTKDITFHFYSNDGTGFIVNFDEVKNYMHYKPDRFARVFATNLSALAMKNIGSITDDDLDKLESDGIDSKFASNMLLLDDTKSDSLVAKLKDDLVQAFKNDETPEDEDDSDVEVVEEDVNVDDKYVEEIKKDEHLLEVKTEHKKNNFTDFFKANKLLAKLFDTSAKFKVDKNYMIASADASLPPVTFKDSELDDILDGSDAENTEDTPEEVDNTTDEEENTVSVDETRPEPSDENDSIDDEQLVEEVSDEYSTPEDEIEPEEEEEEEPEEEYIQPTKKGKGPVKLVNARVEVTKSPAELKRIQVLKDKYNSITINGTNINDIVGNAGKTELEETVNKNLMSETKDKSTKDMAMIDYQRSYVKNNYQADIINAVRSLSNNKDMPLYIQDVKIDDTSTQFDSKLTYTFKLKDETNKVHTLKFDVPKLDENGLMHMNGADLYLKKQLLRRPIVKIGPDVVYITTQLNSYRVFRVGAILNKGSDVIRRIFTEYYVNNPKVEIQRGDSSKDNSDYLTTLEYDALAKNYFAIYLNKGEEYGEEVEIIFNQKRIRDILAKNEKIRTGYPNNELPPNVLPIAINYTKKILYSIDMKENSSVNSTILMIIQTVMKDNDVIEFAKKIKAPKRRMCTMAEIQSFKVPLIAFCNYTFGWERVKSYFKKNEIEFSEKPIKDSSKVGIKFYNGYLYYNQYPLEGALFLNGLSQMKLEDYNYEDLDNPALYLDYVQKKFGTKNVVKGWVTVRECMLDYKTLQILEALNLPTDLLEIFLYCNDLLVDNQVLPESDIRNYRIRGNEVISDCLYKTLCDNYNAMRKRTSKSITLSIPQNAVMSAIHKTELGEYYNALSPAAELKAYNLVTFKGPGGTKLQRAFTMEKRAFNDTYYGTFAISTADNANAGVIKELTVNPKITNTLGFIGEQKGEGSSADISSIEEALIPNVVAVDDPTRIAFVSIQTAHVGGVIHSACPPVRTGFEKTLQFQCGENFVKRVKKDGTITAIDESAKRVYVSYKDGSKECFDYSDVMLKNSDSFNKADFFVDVKVGQKVSAGEPIIYDNRFFKKDFITGDIVYAQAASSMVAIMENTATEDDSSSITASLSEKLGMNFTKKKAISIKPMDNIIEYKKIGDHVELGDPIFVFDDSGAIEVSDDESTEFDELFADVDASDLAQIIHQTPKANLSGEIVDMRVYWTVPTDKMSKSVRQLVNEYSNRIKKAIVEEERFTKQPSKKRMLLQISQGQGVKKDRINGELFDPKIGGVIIEYYISETNAMSIGDKITLNSALKSVLAEVIPGDKEPYTENGVHVGGIFSFISCNARMISSVYINGALGKILWWFSKHWAKSFLKELGQPIPKQEFEDLVPKQ